mmetsp:Transcript_26857/g.57571  ORF Transcript_26857/g.57571 Transcript_26857/m.57571 type:complete len:97 (+) Transcript_26857:223-513(+)
MDAHDPLKSTQYGGMNAKTIGKHHQYFRTKWIIDEISEPSSIRTTCIKLVREIVDENPPQCFALALLLPGIITCNDVVENEGNSSWEKLCMLIVVA